LVIAIIALVASVSVCGGAVLGAIAASMGMAARQRVKRGQADNRRVATTEFGRHKVIGHPDVGHIALDCDTLVVAADDLRIMIYTAEPETEDAERLALAVVLGTQSLID
jgi:MmyB-like transcription regulator ligand binding domain